jgi:hypothetical protein
MAAGRVESVRPLVWIALLGLLAALAFAPGAAAGGANRFLIVPGVSIGPVKLGESQGSVVAIAGPEHPVVSQHNLIHDYPNLQLYVVYLSGRVAEISVSSVEADSRPAYASYHTAGSNNVGVGDSFPHFRSVYPHARCNTTTHPQEEAGVPDVIEVMCAVTAANGNFTTFTFAAPEPETPELAGIGVYVRSLRATAQAEGIP